MPLDPRMADPSGIAPPAADLGVPVAGQRAAPMPTGVAQQVAAIQQSQAVPTEDGGALLMLDTPQDEAGAAALGKRRADTGNLVEGMEEGDLGRLAHEILEGIDADEQSCEPYFEAVKQGIELLGLKNESVDDPFEGASGAIYPMLLIALVRFCANARGELQPAQGPAKVKTQATPEAAVKAIADRKERWLNYYLTVEDRGYYRDCDAGWLQLGLYGSIFRKVYDDPVTGKPRSRFLTPLQLLVSWYAPDLESAHRYTHIDTISTAEAIRRQLAGYYRSDVDFQTSGTEDATQEREAREANDGRTPSDREEDAEQVHMHSHVLVDPAEYGLPAPKGAPEGLPIPYVVTIDRRSEKILRIEEDFSEADTEQGFTRRDTYAHYLMHPGLGFYGWSFISMMASTTNTASTLWRQAINTFLLHTHPGGLRVKGMRQESESLVVGPGEFAEVDTGGLPIDQAVMPLPYRDIPPSWGPLFESVTSAGAILGGTQELQIGEGRQDAPVGTTLALLEAAIKPTAAIFKRLHEAQGHELRMIAARFGKQQGAVYPYVIDGQKGQAIAADFADTADIFPVSDPNIPTLTQRLANAQAVFQLAMQSGGIIDPRAATEDMLTTMGRSPQEIARLMPKPNQGVPADVATEFAAALKGMPLAVGPAQDHEAHIRSHLPILSTDGLPPNVASALLAHIGEHVAAWYRLQAEQAALAQGIQLPPPGQPMPPEMEAAMARAVAGMSDGIITKLGGMLGMTGDPNKAAELAFKRQELAYKLEDSHRKSQETARQDQTELLKMRQASLDAEADRQLKEKELQAKLKLEVLKGIVDAGKQTHAHGLGMEARNRDQLHDWHAAEADRRHKTIEGEAQHVRTLEASAGDRLHQDRSGQADRQHQTGIAMMGHLAGALGKRAEREASATDAAAGRQHEASMAADDRLHQTGIAQLGHQAALEKTKLSGETTLKAAKLKGAAKPPTAAKKPAAKPAAKRR